MKHLIITITTLFCVFTNLAFSQTGTITVTIKGIDNTKGKIEIGLYNKKSDFAIYNKAFMGVAVAVEKNSVMYVFDKIPANTYAIATWHDANENKKIDKNFIGIPSEKYGFSLNKFGTMGPPNFDDVSFKVEKNQDLKLTIILK